MSLWSVKLATGWHDSPSLPADVREAFDVHGAHESECVFIRRGGPLGGLDGGSDITIHDLTTQRGAVSVLMLYLALFCADLEDESVDVACLVFLNRKPTPSPFGRAPERRLEADTLQAGLRAFFEAVEASLQAVSGKSEWVMLACYRIG